MAEFEFNDIQSLDSLLQGFYEKPANTFLWTEDSLDSSPISEVNFQLGSSPASLSSSPISSPLMYQLPSSPSQDFTSSSSSSDEFENDFLSTNTMSGFSIPSEPFTDFSALINNSEGNPIFTFDPTPIKTDEGSAFQQSCLPPLPISCASNFSSNPTPKPSKLAKESKGSSKSSTTKKRRRTAVEPKFTKFDLNEEELLKFNAEEIEDYIRTLSNTKTISPSEEKELKRVRRLIKNREYAQSSRDKRKNYMEGIEGQLNIANQEKAVLQQRVAALELENKTLKYHLAKILKTSASSITSSKNINKTAAVTFFVLMFSFGIFAFGGSLRGVTGNTRSFEFDQSAGHSDFAPRNVRYRSILWKMTEETPDTNFAHEILPTFLLELLSIDQNPGCSDDSLGQDHINMKQPFSGSSRGTCQNKEL